MSTHENEETGQIVEASVKVYLIWDDEAREWTLDHIMSDGYPLDWSQEPVLYHKEVGNADEAHLGRAADVPVDLEYLHSLLQAWYEDEFAPDGTRELCHAHDPGSEYTCTLPDRHAGDHETTDGVGGKVLAQWPR